MPSASCPADRTPASRGGADRRPRRAGGRVRAHHRRARPDLPARGDGGERHADAVRSGLRGPGDRPDAGGVPPHAGAGLRAARVQRQAFARVRLPRYVQHRRHEHTRRRPAARRRRDWRHGSCNPIRSKRSTPPAPTPTVACSSTTSPTSTSIRRPAGCASKGTGEGGALGLRLAQRHPEAGLYFAWDYAAEKPFDATVGAFDQNVLNLNQYEREVPVDGGRCPGRQR